MGTPEVGNLIEQNNNIPEIIEYRNNLDLVTTDKLVESLEKTQTINYYVIFNRATAASIGANIAHSLGKNVIFLKDNKDLSYNSLLKSGDDVLDIDNYIEKGLDKLSKEEVLAYLNYRHKGNFSDEELDILADNKNLLELLKYCFNKNIELCEVGIDPWYGMKSEDSNMIKACELLGFNFIGPTSDAVDLVGDKVSANNFAEETSLRPVPNSGEIKDLKNDLLPFINKEEYKTRKIVLKKSDGGGGAGQFLADFSVEGERDKLIEMAKVWLEKGYKFDANLWIDESRHVEMQLLIDKDGKIFYGSPRDCTSQRAKQKIIEEIASWLDEEQIESLKKSTKSFFDKVEKSLGHPYIGPATFEMLYDITSENFYFLEVNTRKQVEILVSEHQLNQDLVTSCIKIAEGYSVKDVEHLIDENKHTMEARISFEKTMTQEMIDFFKDHGKDAVAEPVAGNVKVELKEVGEGVFLYFDKRILEEGEQVLGYDAMVGQLVVTDENRDKVIKKLKKALKNLKIDGLPSNKELCLEILKSKEFKNNTHHSKTPTVQKFIDKEQSKMKREETVKSIVDKVVKVLSHENEINNQNALTFSPYYTVFIQLCLILESIFNTHSIEGVYIEYNNGGYNLYFRDDESISNFKEYLIAKGYQKEEIYHKLVKN